MKEDLRARMDGFARFCTGGLWQSSLVFNMPSQSPETPVDADTALRAALAEAEALGFDGQFDLVSYVKAAREQNVDAHLARIGRAEKALGEAIGAHVAGRYGELLAELDIVMALEAKLLRNNERVLALTQAVRRVRTSIVGPHDQLRQQVAGQQHAQECADLLRRVQRLVLLVRRLRDLNPLDAKAGGDAKSGGRAKGCALVSTELPKAAATLAELEGVLAGAELGEIDVVRAELPFIEQAGRAVRAQADALLSAAIDDSNQARRLPLSPKHML